MGRAKEEQIEYEQRVQRAIGLCVQVGVIKQCPVHDDVYLDTLEYFDEAELAERVKSDIPGADDEFRSAEDMRECLRDALDQAGDECPICVKNRHS